MSSGASRGSPSDTSAFAADRPHQNDFTRYTLPIYCVAAVARAQEGADHSIAAQDRMILGSVGGDTPLSSEVSAMARRCMTRFPVATRPLSELPNLFTLALVAQDDTTARTVAARWLATTPSGAARDTAVLAIAAQYLAATPARFTTVEVLADQWSAEARASGAQEPTGANARAHLQHMRLGLQLSVQLLADATQRFDTVRMTSSAERVITLGRALSPDPGGEVRRVVVQAYRALATLVFDRPDSIRALATRARADLTALSPRSVFSIDSVVTLIAPSVSDPAYVPTSGSGTASSGAAPLRSLPPLEASTWLPEPPPANTPTLYVFAPQRWLTPGGVGRWNGAPCVKDDLYLVDPGPRRSCDGLVPWLKYWSTQYGGRGVSVVLVVPSTDDPVTLWAPTATRQAQAARYATWFRTQLQLPVTIAVVDDSVTARNDTHGYTTPGYLVTAVLRGPQGTLLARDPWTPDAEFEFVLRHRIDALAPSGQQLDTAPRSTKPSQGSPP